MRAALIAAVAALLLVPATAAAAEVSNPTPVIGEMVTVRTVVPADGGGDVSYMPAAYVDWDAGTCPGSVSAARSAAKGHFRRGLGVAHQSESETAVPLSARVRIETRQQRVCFYTPGGNLGDQIVIAGTPRLPLLDRSGNPARRWSLGGGLPRMNSFGIAIQLDRLSPLKSRPSVFALIRCVQKRFFLRPGNVKLDADGNFSYRGAVVPDNSRNYDQPIPRPFHGRATLNVRGTIGIGATELEAPVLDGVGGGEDTLRKGPWGTPIIRVSGRFSAPGYHPNPRQPLCVGSFKYILVAAVASPDRQPFVVMPGQGSARMATEDGVHTGEEAGVPF